jgi:hypothetical protein
MAKEKVAEVKTTQTEEPKKSFLMTFLTRVVAGAGMLSGFTLVVYMGHVYVTLLGETTLSINF